MKNKYNKLLIYLFSIGVIIIFSFGIYQYLTHFSTRDEAIEKYITEMFDIDSTQLIDVVETDISNALYLMLIICYYEQMVQMLLIRHQT